MQTKCLGETMVNFLLVLVVFCGALSADDDTDKKRSISSNYMRKNFWDDEDAEKAAKRQKKSGSKSVSPKGSNRGAAKTSVIAIFDKNKLGPAPSSYSDEQKRVEQKNAKNFASNIRYVGLTDAGPDKKRRKLN